MDNTRRKFLIELSLATAGLGVAGRASGATHNSTPDITTAIGKIPQEIKNNSIIEAERTLSEYDFFSVPDASKPWVYYWWLKGNVTKKLIARDLGEMKEKGIGGFLFIDSRGYHDGYHDGIVPVPLQIKLEFMSPEWREMVKYMMQEAARLGLKVSINIANTGGALRGPWDMKEEGPKNLIWTASTVVGPQKISVKLEIPSDKKYFQDVALIAVQVKSKDENSKESDIELNGSWNEITERTENALIGGSIVDLKSKLKDNILQWEVPEGAWRIIRFGYYVIGDVGSVDILNSQAVTKYFHLMGTEILKDAGELVGKTLTHFYNVSWEGGRPNWTIGFENEFLKYRGYDMQPYMAMLTGMTMEDSSIYSRFMHDYFRTISDCFKNNCYEVIGALCHKNGLQWHSENGGPWTREAAMFKEADQLSFWGENDMPQGEFWCSGMDDLTEKSNVRYTAMAAHTHDRSLVAVESFTHMDLHWTKYPAYLKPFADINFVDGGNFLIWHTFTASPLNIGKPGYEYFAGTHFNPNVTWWNKAGNFLDYLGRCQYLLRAGQFVADVCCYVSDENYVRWGRGKKWNEQSSLFLDSGYSYDLINTEVLVDRLSVEDGKLVLPGGMHYQLLVVDLTDTHVPLNALKKIIELAKSGASILLGHSKPDKTGELKDYPECDKEVLHLANELWSEGLGMLHEHALGKGKIYKEPTMNGLLKHKNILPDFEGPFEYIHRSNDKEEIYFISGEGRAECTFRIKERKPEIWDPVNGRIADAVSYRFTDDGRTVVPVDLPENGAVFVVFRKKVDKKHFVSTSGPGGLELVERKEDGMELALWERGEYMFASSGGKTRKITVEVNPPIKLNGPWNIKFEPEEGGPAFATTFNELMLWNEHSEPNIKHFAGTAVYQLSVSITEEQLNFPARLQLGKVFDISKVWINGTDMGVVWTAPWTVDLTDILKKGTNELKIEITNCWANRLIGDAGLPPNERKTETNVRLVSNREKYPNRSQAFSAQDPLLPSGLVGPVFIEFGKKEEVIF